MVMIFPTMINKDSTAKMTVQKNNSAVLHRIAASIFPIREKFVCLFVCLFVCFFFFFHFMGERQCNSPCS